ncbi:hypothetical protein BKA62DRAFT_675476, partial [Auriculariales sp. MPI-PUGE-AT-0066]
MPSLAGEDDAHVRRAPEFTPTVQRAQADLNQYRLTVAAILASPFATNLPDEAYVHHRTPILPARTIERLNPTVAAFLIRRLVDTHKEDALKIAILQSELEVMSKRLDLTAKSLECLVCALPLWRPRTLVCGHTFCGDCLDRLELEPSQCNKCPTCRDESGWDILSTNFKLEELVSILWELCAKHAATNVLGFGHLREGFIDMLAIVGLGISPELLYENLVLLAHSEPRTDAADGDGGMWLNVEAPALVKVREFLEIKLKEPTGATCSAKMVSLRVTLDGVGVDVELGGSRLAAGMTGHTLPGSLGMVGTVDGGRLLGSDALDVNIKVSTWRSRRRVVAGYRPVRDLERSLRHDGEHVDGTVGSSCARSQSDRPKAGPQTQCTRTRHTQDRRRRYWLDEASQRSSWSNPKTQRVGASVRLDALMLCVLGDMVLIESSSTPRRRVKPSRGGHRAAAGLEPGRRVHSVTSLLESAMLERLRKGAHSHIDVFLTAYEKASIAANAMLIHAHELISGRASSQDRTRNNCAKWFLGLHVSHIKARHMRACTTKTSCGLNGGSDLVFFPFSGAGALTDAARVEVEWRGSGARILAVLRRRAQLHEHFAAESRAEGCHRAGARVTAEGQQTTCKGPYLGVEHKQMRWTWRSIDDGVAAQTAGSKCMRLSLKLAALQERPDLHRRWGGPPAHQIFHYNQLQLAMDTLKWHQNIDKVHAMSPAERITELPAIGVQMRQRLPGWVTPWPLTYSGKGHLATSIITVFSRLNDALFSQSSSSHSDQVELVVRTPGLTMRNIQSCYHRARASANVNNFTTSMLLIVSGIYEVLQGGSQNLFPLWDRKPREEPDETLQDYSQRSARWQRVHHTRLLVHIFLTLTPAIILIGVDFERSTNRLHWPEIDEFAHFLQEFRTTKRPEFDELEAALYSAVVEILVIMEESTEESSTWQRLDSVQRSFATKARSLLECMKGREFEHIPILKGTITSQRQAKKRAAPPDDMEAGRSKKAKLNVSVLGAISEAVPVKWEEPDDLMLVVDEPDDLGKNGDPVGDFNVEDDARYPKRDCPSPPCEPELLLCPSSPVPNTVRDDDLVAIAEKNTPTPTTADHNAASANALAKDNAPASTSSDDDTAPASSVLEQSLPASTTVDYDTAPADALGDENTLTSTTADQNVAPTSDTVGRDIAHADSGAAAPKTTGTLDDPTGHGQPHVDKAAITTAKYNTASCKKDTTGKGVESANGNEADLRRSKRNFGTKEKTTYKDTAGHSKVARTKPVVKKSANPVEEEASPEREYHYRHRRCLPDAWAVARQTHHIDVFRSNLDIPTITVYGDEQAEDLRTFSEGPNAIIWDGAMTNKLVTVYAPTGAHYPWEDPSLDDFARAKWQDGLYCLLAQGQSVLIRRPKDMQPSTASYTSALDKYYAASKWVEVQVPGVIVDAGDPLPPGTSDNYWMPRKTFTDWAEESDNTSGINMLSTTTIEPDPYLKWLRG